MAERELVLNSGKYYFPKVFLIKKHVASSQRMPRAIHINKALGIRKAFYWDLRRVARTKTVTVQQCSKTTSRATCKQGLKNGRGLCSAQMLLPDYDSDD
jgi:hypothetical protein